MAADVRGRFRIQAQVLSAFAILSALAVALPAAAAQRVLVVSPAENDARIALVHGAITYWNDVFAELKLERPLIEAGVAVKPPGVRAIENFAWQISRLAGRLPEGVDGPPPPPELLALDGDVVVLLSAQPLLPFARPLTESGRYLVAIARSREGSAETSADRNVFAHELGHTLGLRHGDDPAGLMCEPCSPADDASTAGYRPLSDTDRARLIEIYGSRVP